MYNIECTAWMKKYWGDLAGKSVAEYGNQLIWEHAKQSLSTQYDIARDWMLNDLKVSDYISLDINGEDGALPVDLTDPLPPILENRFDVVTNIGTTEHFGGDPNRQWRGHYNAVSLGKTGSVILHQMPPFQKAWDDHCEIWYKPGIGQVLARCFGCVLLDESIITLDSMNREADHICVALKKDKIVPFTHEIDPEFLTCLVYKQTIC